MQEHKMSDFGADVEHAVTNIGRQRNWQIKIPIEGTMTVATNPLFGANTVRGRSNLTDRNLRRIANKSKPASVIHFASVEGLESEDARKAKNATKRLRKSLRNGSCYRSG